MGVRKLKIVTVIGARPQFIKAAPVSALIRDKYQGRIQEILVHTGQHYDRNMSNIFFRQMRIPKPKYHLRAGGGTHGAMTGRMMEKIEKVLLKEKPDWVLVYGDTNSTLAGALSAVKLHIPVAHVEAGLRSFNIQMPEEINRILTDRISTLLFCPTLTAVKNLKKEGITDGVYFSGDVMLDAVRMFRGLALKIPLSRWGLEEKSYAFCTIHRQENTNEPRKLKEILQALRKLGQKDLVVFAIHPRTRRAVRKYPALKRLLQLSNSRTGARDLEKGKQVGRVNGIMVLEPMGYLETQRVVMGAKTILTDSGGLQKEAFFHRTACITLRNETEWAETVAAGWNQIVGADRKKIIRAAQKSQKAAPSRNSIYGNGRAAKKIVAKLGSHKW
jgi:UDP-GlcNAc3NAcA epimerase